MSTEIPITPPPPRYNNKGSPEEDYYEGNNSSSPSGGGSTSSTGSGSGDDEEDTSPPPPVKEINSAYLSSSPPARPAATGGGVQPRPFTTTSSSSLSESSHNSGAVAATTRKVAPPPTQQPTRATSNSNNKKSKAAPVSYSREELRRQVYRAFCEIPAQDKGAYLKAMEKVPELVLRESDPIRFLQRESGDAHAAASLLATYWTKRESLFGDRSLLPMNLTGNGALSNSDIAVLKNGTQVFLPTDSKGRTVLYVDDSRDANPPNEAPQRSQQAPQQPFATSTAATAQGTPNFAPSPQLDAKDVRLAQFRCAFALYTQASQEEKPVVMVRFANDYPDNATPPRLPKKIDAHQTKKQKSNNKLCEMFEYMPSKLDSMICLYAPGNKDGTTRQHEEASFQDKFDRTAAATKLPYGYKMPTPKTAPPTATTTNATTIMSAKVKEYNPLFEEYRAKRCFTGVVVHNVVGGNSPQETLELMEKHGFTKEGLPLSAGGTWKYTNHELWVNQKQEKELVEERVTQEKAAALHEYAKLAALSSFGPKKHKRSAAAASASTSSERLRAAAAAAAVAGSPKKKAKLMGAALACSADALPVIARLAAATTNARGKHRKDRKRRLDVIYSRNRRQREKKEEHELQGQVTDLKRTNDALKKTEKKLAQLIADAHCEIEAHHQEVGNAEAATAALSKSQAAAAAVNNAASAAGTYREVSVTGSAPHGNTNASDLQAILQLLSQHEGSKAVSAPPPQPVMPSPSSTTQQPNLGNSAEVLMPIMQRMLTGQEMGSQDILAVIMMLVGHLQKAGQSEASAAAAAQRHHMPPAPPQPSSTDAMLLQLLGAVMNGEQQQQQHQQREQQARAQELQRQQQKQHQQQQEANLLSNLLSQLQGSNSGGLSVPQLAALASSQPLQQQYQPQQRSASTHRTTQEALLQLLLSNDSKPAAVARPSPPQQQQACDFFRQVPQLVHRHSQSSGSGTSSLSGDRETSTSPHKKPAAPVAAPTAKSCREHHSSSNNINRHHKASSIRHASTSNVARQAPSNNVNNNRSQSGLDVLQLMLSLAGGGANPQSHR